MKKKTKSLIVSLVLAFAMLLSAPFALVKTESAKAYGVNEVAPASLFTYTQTGEWANYFSPKVATAENGLRSEVASYANKGVLAALFKTGTTTGPNKVVTKSFDTSALTKNDKLFEFLPAGEYSTNWRAYLVKISDGTHTVNVYVGNKESNNTGYGHVKGGNADAMYVQAVGQAKLGGLTNGATGTFISNGSEDGINVASATGTAINDTKPIVISYDASEKAIYTVAPNGNVVLVRDLDATDATNGNDSAFAGFSGPVTVTVTHSSGAGIDPAYSANNAGKYGILVTAIAGVDLATDADGKIIDTYRYAGGKISASPYKNLAPVTVEEGQSAPISAPVRRDGATLDASEKENWTVTAIDADGADVTATAVSGLAEGKWVEGATINPTRGTTVVTMANATDKFTQAFEVAGLKQAKITLTGATGTSAVKIGENACADFTDVAEGEVAIAITENNQVCLSILVNGEERIADVVDGVLTLAYDELTYKTEIVATFSAVWTMTLKEGETSLGTIITPINTPFTQAEADAIVKRDGFTWAYKVDNADYDWATNATADATVSVVYTPIAYTVAIEADGGTADPAPQYPATINVVDAVTLPVIAKDGYTFNGWFLDDEFTTSFDGGVFATAYEFEESGVITFYAKFTLDEFVITYDGQGGTVTGGTEKYSIVSGFTVASLATVAREGYTFEGWFNGETEVDDPATITEPMIKAGLTLTAKWTAIEYDLEFWAEGVQLGETTKFTVENTEITLPDAPAKQHYDFIGWFIDGTSTKVRAGAYKYPASDLTIVAKYVPTNKELEWITNGGRYTNDATYLVNVETEASDIVFPDATRRGFDFAGWYTDPEFTAGNEFNVGTYEFTGVTITVYAKWTAITYDATFNVEGDETTDTFSSDKVDAITFPADPEKPYNNFVGWFIGEDEVTAETFDYTVGEDVTIVAKFEEIKYSVKWHTNGGTITDTEYDKYITKSMVDVGVYYMNVPAIEKYGYTFDGWVVLYVPVPGADPIEVPVYDGYEAYLTEEYLVDDYGQFYAKWTINTYTLTINGMGGTVGTEETTTTFTVESTEIKLPSASKTGLIFEGWYTSMACLENEKVVAGAYKFPASNLTLYAKYDVENFDVKFMVDSEVFGTVNVAKGASITKLSVIPAKTGYNFVGWYNGDTAYVFGGAITADVTLTAKFEAIKYQIVLGGATLDSNIVEFTVEDTALTLPTPERAGYVFDGWYENGVKVDETYVITAGNKTFEAVWVEDTTAPKKDGCGKEAAGLLAVVLSALAAVLVIKKK